MDTFLIGYIFSARVNFVFDKYCKFFNALSCSIFKLSLVLMFANCILCPLIAFLIFTSSLMSALYVSSSEDDGAIVCMYYGRNSYSFWVVLWSCYTNIDCAIMWSFWVALWSRYNYADWILKC